MTLQLRRGVAALYLAAGILLGAGVGYVLWTNPAPFEKGYLNALFVLMVCGLAVLSLLRCKTTRLELRPDEIFFYNGLLDLRHIPLARIEGVDYNPEVRLRLHVRRQDGSLQLQRLSNVFDRRQTEELLAKLAERGIKVARLSREEFLGK